jgi:hypothetical protein
MRAAASGLSRYRSDTSRLTMRPSDVGTAAVSFSSRVCVLNLMTRVPGTTKLMPGPSAASDAVPKKSLTPTWPAGTTVADRYTTKNATKPSAAMRIQPKPKLTPSIGRGNVGMGPPSSG